MASLREKLQQIDSTLSKHNKRYFQQAQSNGESVDSQDGRIEKTEFGSCLVVEKCFPLSHQQGTLPLQALLENTGVYLAFIAKNHRFKYIDPSDLLFIDTETTGLSGGTGTYIFLAGVGYFDGDCFRILQYLMRNFDEEKAILHLINQLALKFNAAVSYNGKTFDFALFRTRCVLSQIENQLDKLLHLDLVHTSRRLWKNRLPECTLASVEKGILGFTRAADIPGFLIPSIYFEFLQTQKDGILRSVLSHNVLDVLSLVGITTAACNVFQSNERSNIIDHNPWGVITTYEEMGYFDKAIKACEIAAEKTANEDEAVRYLLKRAFILKRQQMWEKAKLALQSLIIHSRFHPLPFIELAKILEHRKRDLTAALAYIDQALQGLSIINELSQNQDYNVFHADLLHRRQRILRKLAQRTTERENGNGEIIPAE